MATNTAMQRDIGAYVKLAVGVPPVRLTAGGSGDNVDQAGSAINRDGYLSALVGLSVSASLASGQKITASVRVQDSADGITGWTDFLGDDAAVPTPVELLYANMAAGQLQLYPINLSAARTYVRVVAKGDLSAGSTDTAILAAQIVLGGAHTYPAV
jgi:hypothetical protein